MSRIYISVSCTCNATFQRYEVEDCDHPSITFVAYRISATVNLDWGYGNFVQAILDATSPILLPDSLRKRHITSWKFAALVELEQALRYCLAIYTPPSLL